jgi:hypothetical protein
VTPTWLDIDRLQQLLVIGSVLAVALTLVLVVTLRPAARKLVAGLAFGALAVAGAWQHAHLEDERRADCAGVELLGSQVRVPGCPGTRPG